MLLLLPSVEYERLKNTLCGGRIIESFKNLQDAKEACDSSYECGCISDQGAHLDKFTTHFGTVHYPARGGIAYVRLDRTKGIHMNILLPKSYKSFNNHVDISWIIYSF